MRAFTSNLPTTPGYKLERRTELETMCEQIKYMTANKERGERFTTEPEYEDYESSDDENNIPNTNIPLPKDISNDEQQSKEKIIHKRPVEGVIPCYWATLTTAPFRSSVISYYITGKHDTDDDVRLRRHLAIQQPNIVSFFLLCV